MNKETVYKIDSKGRERIWSIWVEGWDDNGIATICIESGLVDGGKVSERIPITEGKNIGKKNATTPYTQAVAQAQAKLELKLRGEYVRDLKDASQGVLRSGIEAPMLAQKYDPKGLQKGSKTLDKMKIRGQKIHVQPKLDGNRCLIKVSAPRSAEQLREEMGLVDLDIELATAVMYTRKGDVMPVQLKHILDEVLDNYKTLYLMDCHNFEELTLDGELFSDKLTFNELNGHLKRKDSQDAEQLAKIKHHLYDVMLPATYDQRFDFIRNFASEHVELIPSFEIEATDENIKTYLEQFLAEGHEGLMIRTLDTGYENKRSWQLVKVKLFEDEEFEIVDIFLDARSGKDIRLVTDEFGETCEAYSDDESFPIVRKAPLILGGFVMKMKEPTKDRAGKDILTFKAGVTAMDRDEQLKVINNKDKYIGKQATVEFFGKSEYGVPRFPKMKAVRDDA